LWHISTVSFAADDSDEVVEGTDTIAKLEKLEEKKADIETVVEIRSAVATMSSTAIVASIAFPSLFNISISFSLPIGMPKFLSVLGAWLAQAVSVDLGQFGSPECSLDTPEPLSTFKLKFFLTHAAFLLVVLALYLRGVFGTAGDRLHATSVYQLGD
jgi:hypothetical protein